MMKVRVEIITGTFIDTEVTDNATVRELKEKIAREVKLPVKRLILVVEDEYEEEGRILMKNEDEMMLRDLGVREDSHMYLFFKHLDLVVEEERSHGGGGGGDEVSTGEVSSEADSKRGNEEGEEEKAKIDVEKEDDDKSMKNEEEDRDGKEEKEKDGEEAKDDDVKDGEDEAIGDQEGDKKEETQSFLVIL